MSDNNYDIKYNILPIKELDNGRVFQVSLLLPMSYGWYDDVTMVVDRNWQTRYFPLKYSRSEEGMAIFESTIELETCAIMHYYFTCRVNGFFKYIKNGVYFDHREITPEEKLKLSVNFEAPDFAKGAIMYHIFVDRFRKGKKEELPKMDRRIVHKSWDEEMVIGPNEEGIWNADFYGGDLLGIEEKIDYIKSLGVDIIYLSPIVWSQSNHRYDTSDYMAVDPYAGSNDDLRSLCDAAHKKGMKIILDAVFNHTGNDSKYFNEYGTFNSLGAFQSASSPYANFYRKKIVDGKEEYDYWWGMKNLPVCDGTSEEWKNFITGPGGVIDHWFNLGIDGLRLDVADELTDEFIALIKSSVKRNKKDGFILGEVWKNPMRMNRDYIESGVGMDSVMNYLLVDALIRYFKYGDVEKLATIIKEIKNEYPQDTINTLMNFTSTHDISRAINIFASNVFQTNGEWSWNPTNSDINYCHNYKLTKEQYNYGKNIYEAYIFALTFLPGILSIFYGDEVGVEGLGNLANRKTFPWGMEDKDLLEYFHYIGNIRKNEKFLKEAELNIVDINPNYLMFERKTNDESILVTINNTDEERKIALPSEYEKSSCGIYTLKKSTPHCLKSYGAVAVKKQ